MSAPPLETNSGGLAKDMTLRDAAALAALPSCLAICRHDTRPAGEAYEVYVARQCYDIADALLIERERGE